VDASGRASQATSWLGQLGFPPARKVRVDAGLGYASRRYRIPTPAPTDWRMLILPFAPPNPRGGVVFPVQDGSWIVTLAGMGGDCPPTDEPGFLRFAASLRSPLLFEAILHAQPLSPIFGYRHTSNRWRRFERLARWPERFVVVGDGVCAVNPVYAQGMTVAATHAVALDQALTQQRRRRSDRDLAGFARSFQRQVARCSRAAWLTATAEDLRYPTTSGGRRGPVLWLLHRYGDAVLATANGNQAVQQAFLDVLHLQASPASLLRPGVAWPALTGRHEPALTELPPAPRRAGASAR
jgi:hypothetical protein